MTIIVNFDRVDNDIRRRFAHATMEHLGGNDWAVTLKSNTGMRRVELVEYDLKQGDEFGLLAEAVRQATEKEEA